MESLKKQYGRIFFEKNALTEQIRNLEENETVKKYFELCRQKEKLSIQQANLYRQLKAEKYASCNHIWVNTLHEYDSSEGRAYNYYGCIKCGLDERVFHQEELNGLDFFTSDQRIMYDFMQEHDYKRGIWTNIFCDLDLAQVIYSKVKEAHPDIDDDTARKYFEIDLDNIGKILVNEEEKTSRAKKLSLSSKFNK